MLIPFPALLFSSRHILPFVTMKQEKDRGKEVRIPYHGLAFCIPFSQTITLLPAASSIHLRETEISHGG